MSRATSRAAVSPAHRLLIFDPGLRDATGHHLPLVDALVAEAQRRGRRVAVLGHRAMAPDLRDRRYGPHFRAWTYDSLSEDPIAGWLETHMLQTGSVLDDLTRLPVGPADILFWPTASAAHVQALAAWAAGRSNRLIICPGFGVGLDRDNNLVGAEAVAWRYAFRGLQALAPAAEVISWSDSIEQHRHVARPLPVRRVPAPQGGSPRDRGADAPLTIGIVGHQRAAKGFRLVPEILIRLGGALGDRARFVVHDCGDEPFDAEWSALERLGCEILRESLADAAWHQLLDRLSLLLLPYRPDAYAATMSGIAAEAFASGLPMVVPAGSEPAATARRLGAGVATFAEWSPEAVARAAEAMALSLPYQAGLSLAAATRWNAGNGVPILFDSLGL